MSPFSVCSYRYEEEKRLINVLSVYIHPVSIDDELLDEAIAPVLSSQGPFERMNIHGTPDSIERVIGILKGESSSLARIKNTRISIDQKLTFVSWAKDGGRFIATTFDGTVLDNTPVISLERRFSLFDAFVQNNGLVNAARGTHFTKPSKSHSLQFLRAANVLEHSAVSHQIVFWLYPLLQNKAIHRLIVDTSGIASVAYALAYERMWRGHATSLPIIESHGSYGGLENLTVTDPEGTVFLISASTSGSLANKLIEKGAKAENIFTLFYLGGQTPGAVLCDLAADKSCSFAGLPLIINYPENDCPECKKHSYPISIMGDQFRTEPAKIEQITVRLDDFDEETRSILDKVVSTGLFKVFRTVENREFELYLDVDNMLNGMFGDDAARARVEDIGLRLQRLLNRGLPVHLRRIVATDYPGASEIAETAHAALPAGLRSEVKIVKMHELLDELNEAGTATLVVSGCMDDAYDLTGISRDLRTVQPGGSITYVSPIFRSTSATERKITESNLTYGDQGPKTFSQLSVINLDLPQCSIRHSWIIEFERLEAVQYWCDKNEKTVPVGIVQRIELLRLAPATGLVNDLFWPNPSGENLVLAADFTMIPTQDGRRPVPQADVFAIVSSLFHKYRQGAVRGKPRLTSHTYERTVISPATFTRFSDGVLQAAFLRAAREGELAYANCNHEISSSMLAFLFGEVRAAEHGGGHALMEYLIAILVGRLTLHEAHMKAFLDSVTSASVSDHHLVVAYFLKGELEGVGS